MGSVIDLDGRVAVVTGGTRGIGRAIAESLADAGAAVVPTARTAADVDQAAEAIRDRGVESLAHPTDVTKPAEVAALFEETAATLGSVDIVVNNAGINTVAGADRPEALDPAAFRRHLQVNLEGAFTCTHEAGEYLVAGDGGSLINIASVFGVVGTERQHGYVASKHGMIGLTKSVALDWAPTVRANAIAPGYVSTELTAPLEADDQRYESLLDRTPLDRFADPEEIADAALFLASDMSSFVTGSCLVADGGWSVR